MSQELLNWAFDHKRSKSSSKGVLSRSVQIVTTDPGRKKKARRLIVADSSVPTGSTTAKAVQQVKRNS